MSALLFLACVAAGWYIGRPLGSAVQSIVSAGAVPNGRRTAQAGRDWTKRPGSVGTVRVGVKMAGVGV